MKVSEFVGKTIKSIDFLEKENHDGWNEWLITFEDGSCIYVIDASRQALFFSNDEERNSAKNDIETKTSSEFWKLLD